MADLERAKTALVNAHNAGDVAAAKQLANYIKSQQQATVKITTDTRKMDPIKAFSVGLEQGPTFGMADELAAFGAGIGGAIRPDRTFSESYNRRLEEKRQELKSAKQERPISTMIGEMTGAVASGGGLLKLGGKNLAKLAATAPLRTASGLGALSGGVYGFGTGEGGGAERLGQGAISSIAGGALGPVAVLAGRGISKVAGKFAKSQSPATAGTAREIAEQMEEAGMALVPSTPKQESAAISKVAAAIKKDFPQNYEQVMEAWKAGDSTLAELYGPRITRLAKGAAQYKSGEAQAKQFFERETLAAPERIKSAVSKNISNIENYFKTADDIVEQGRARAAPLYEKAYQDVLPQMEISPEVGQAIAVARRKFPSELKGFDDNSIKTLDYAKRIIDDQINTAKRQGQNNFVRSRTQIKNDLLALMDNISPSYKAARAKSADYLSIEDAMDQGRSFMQLDPALVKKTFSKMSEDEKAAFKIGVGKQIRDIIDKTGEGANPYNKVFGNKFQRERLMNVLSPNEFKNLESSLKAENRLFKMRNEVLGGSPTTTKAMAAAEIAAGGAEALQAIATGNVRSFGLGQIRQIIGKAFDGINDNTAGQISKIIYETDPAQKLVLLDRVVKNPQLTQAEKQIIKSAYFKYEEIAKNSIRSATSAAPLASGAAEVIREQ